MECVKQSKKALNKAVLAIKKGEVIICPTDTVYGFLADASNKKAVEKIFKIKKRVRSKFLPVFIKDIKMARDFAEISDRQEKIIKKYWPGEFTLVFKREPDKKLFGVDKNTIALRIPEYKFLNSLLKKINKPLVQTSVNISDQSPLFKISDIKDQFGRYNILLIDGGNLPIKKPSKVVDFTKDKIKILRP